MNGVYHKTVLLEEVVHYMAPQPSGIYIDATFGGGGHTRALLEAEPTCQVIAFDIDKDALDLNGAPLKELFGDRLKLVWSSFVMITKVLKKEKIGAVNGILADFGTSQYQIFQKEGFSFAVDSPLDMRMSAAHTAVTAADIVNKASQKELATIFYDYGEEHQSRKIAQAIVNYRSDRGPIMTTGTLAHIIEQVIRGRDRAIHPATKVFQALRIVVNDELNAINSLLMQSIPLLAAYGRLVFISFHSLEDRMVKQFFNRHADSLKVLTPKVITANPEEKSYNPSSRSAKLRAAEKLLR